MTDLSTVYVSVDDGDQVVEVEVEEVVLGGGGGDGGSSLYPLPQKYRRDEFLAAVMLSEQIVHHPPAVYLVSTDPWPFTGFTNFVPGNVNLFTDCSFRVVDYASGTFRVGLKLEGTGLYPKNGLTFVGGNFYGGRTEVPESTSRGDWHDFYIVTVLTEDTTFVGQQIWNTGDGIADGTGDDGQKADRLKIIGVAFDAPENWSQDLTGCPDPPYEKIGDRCAWVHDDAIQLDGYRDVEVDDVLINGAFVCVSILAAGSGSGNDASGRKITIRNTLMRSAPVFHVHDEEVYGNWRAGPWLKTHDVPGHAGYRPDLLLEGCVLYAPDNGGMMPEFSNAWDLPSVQKVGQTVEARDCLIIWPNEPFPYRTNWDLYGTNITYFDDCTPEEALAEWNRHADAWREAHPTLDHGRVAPGAGPGVDLVVGDLTVEGQARFEGTTSPSAVFTDGFSLSNGKVMDFGTTAGGYLGRNPTQKIGKWGADPIVQPPDFVRPTATQAKIELTDASTHADLLSVVAAMLDALIDTGELGT